MVGAQKPASGIVHSVYPVAQDRKVQLLTTMLQREVMMSVLVFVKRKRDADQLARSVTRSGVRATSIHSDRSQEERIAALEAFRRGECPVLVATDVAARGIDVEGISHVINFDFPMHPEDYVHRIGRTGRAEAIGDAISFVTNDDAPYVRDLEKMIGKRIERRSAPGFAHREPVAIVAHHPARPAQRPAQRPGQRPAARPAAHTPKRNTRSRNW